jgi:hypothetical protein
VYRRANGCDQLALSAVRVSWNVLSSGTSPAAVVYVLRAEGLVKVCAPAVAMAPLGEAPVSESTFSSSPSRRSSPKSRSACVPMLRSFTRLSLSP